MSEHDHTHEHENVVQGIPVDPKETEKLLAKAQEHVGSSLGYFLSKAADAKTRYVRAYWMRRVEGARYRIERRKALAKLEGSARRNAEANARLEGTESSLELVTVVGNACVLKLVYGRIFDGRYSLIRRKTGETGTTDYGAPYRDQWTVQSLEHNTVHEFAVVSHDRLTANDVTGPWLAVSIGNVSTETIQKAQAEEAKRASQLERDSL